jgi:hypothetical protein
VNAAGVGASFKVGLTKLHIRRLGWTCIHMAVSRKCAASLLWMHRLDASGDTLLRL